MESNNSKQFEHITVDIPKNRIKRTIDCFKLNKPVYISFKNVKLILNNYEHIVNNLKDPINPKDNKYTIVFDEKSLELNKKSLEQVVNLYNHVSKITNRKIGNREYETLCKTNKFNGSELYYENRHEEDIARNKLYSQNVYQDFINQLHNTFKFNDSDEFDKFDDSEDFNEYDKISSNESINVPYKYKTTEERIKEELAYSKYDHFFMSNVKLKNEIPCFLLKSIINESINNDFYKQFEKFVGLPKDYRYDITIKIPSICCYGNIKDEILSLTKQFAMIRAYDSKKESYSIILSNKQHHDKLKETLCKRLFINNKENFIKFGRLLHDTKSSLTGSFMLQCLFNERYNTDVDIFCKQSKIFEILYFFQTICNDKAKDNSLKINTIFCSKNRHLHKVYNIEPYGTLNKIHTIIEFYYHGNKIQIIGLNDDTNVYDYIDESFDFSFCKLSYNGFEIIPKHDTKEFNEIVHKRGTINPASRYVQSRYNKYEERGFKLNPF